MNLHEDLISLILDFLLHNVSDFYHIRSVDKYMLTECQKKWFKYIEPVNAARTLINFRLCQVCQGIANKNKTVPYGWFPRPIYIFCSKFECCRIIYRNVVENARSQNIILLTSPAVKNEEGYCPRSDGSVSDCIFERRWLWNGDVPRIRCMIDVKGSTGIKDVSLNQIDPKLLNEYKIVRL